MDSQKQELTISKVTKVLIHKTHGGRKKDSKFWNDQVELDQKNIEQLAIPITRKAKDKKRTGKIKITPMLPFSIFLVVVVSLIIARPDLFSFLEYHSLYSTMSKILPGKNKNPVIHDEEVIIDISDNGLYQEQNRQQPKKKIFEEQKPKNPPRIQLQPDNLVGKKSYFEGVEKISLTGKVFSWKDKDGKMYFSNTDFPIDNETLQVQTEINGYSKVTKIKVTGGQIYIPVKLSNKGLSSTMHMVLDTGCTTTTVPYKYLTHLSPKYGREVVSRLADGNKMTSREVYLDMIQVGPRKERNVVLHAANIAGSQNDGLLGLDFLKNHKFKIDFENQFILWM